MEFFVTYTDKYGTTHTIGTDSPAAAVDVYYSLTADTLAGYVSASQGFTNSEGTQVPTMEWTPATGRTIAD